MEKDQVLELEETTKGLDLGHYGQMFEGVHIPAAGTTERKQMERRLVWKIDLTILPAVTIMFLLNYLDRNNLAAAKLSTMQKDLSMTTIQFSTAQAILFATYIGAQIPANILLERLGKPQLFLPGVMILWGFLSAMIAAIHSYGALIAIRLLLGIFEAAFYPGVTFYLSCWYTRTELAKRMTIFYCGVLISGAFSGLITYGVLAHLDGAHGLQSWRWLFLIEGVATVGMGFIVMATLPELPATTRWLSAEERMLGVVRLVEDFGQADEDYEAPDSDTKKGVFTGLLMAFKDPKVHLFFWGIFMEAATVSVNTVFPTIVQSLGFSQLETLLLTAPPWVLVTITSVIVSWSSDHFQERYKHILIGPSVALVAFIIAISTTKTAPRYVAMMLLLQIYNSWGLGWAWASSSLPRPPIKRASAIAIINIGGNLANIWTPYIFTSDRSPHFWIGFIYCIVACVLMLSIFTYTRFYLAGLNKRLDAGETIDGMTPESGFRFTL